VTYTGSVDQLLSGDEMAVEKLESRENQAQLENLAARIHGLSARDDAQRAHLARALSLVSQLSDTRFENIVQIGGTIPRPLFWVLVSWLAILLIGFGMFSPKHLTAAAGLFACALCLSGALVVLVELDRPLSGLIKINAAPMRNAISHLGE
jgi:membrane-bound ClpP family serine protease